MDKPDKKDPNIPDQLRVKRTEGQPLHYYYSREERLAMPSAANLKVYEERMRVSKKKRRRFMGLLYIPLAAILLLFYLFKDQLIIPKNDLNGYTVSLKTEVAGDMVYASVVVVKARKSSLPPEAEIQVVFSGSGGVPTQVLAHRLPQKVHEAEVVHTIFAGGGGPRTITAEVTMGDKKQTLTGSIPASSP